MPRLRVGAHLRVKLARWAVESISSKWIEGWKYFSTEYSLAKNALDSFPKEFYCQLDTYPSIFVFATNTYFVAIEQLLYYRYSCKPRITYWLLLLLSLCWEKINKGELDFRLSFFRSFRAFRWLANWRENQGRKEENLRRKCKNERTIGRFLVPYWKRVYESRDYYLLLRSNGRTEGCHPFRTLQSR